MDIKEKIDKVVNKVKSDKNFKNKLMKDPVNALEEVLGVDLPNEQIDKIIDGVKAKSRGFNGKCRRKAEWYF